MTRLLALWHKLWADFDDEVSLTLTRDRARFFLSTTPARFAIYLALILALTASLLAVCGRREVDAPTASPPTPTPLTWEVGGSLGGGNVESWVPIPYLG